MSIVARSVLLALLLLSSAARLPAQEANRPPAVPQPEPDSGPDDPRGREEWFLQGRTMPGGSAAEMRLRAFRQKMAARAAATRTAAAQPSAVQPLGAVAGGTGPQWQNLGPSPIITTPGQSYGAVSGRMTSVAVDQTDTTGNTVYAGAAYCGLWKSTNAAAADPTKVVWTPLIEDQASLAVGAIAISPADHNLLLVGTGEANGSGDSYYGVGVLRSTDGGTTWTLITSADAGSRPFRGLAFSRIAFSTDDPNLVVASTSAAGHGSSIGAETSSAGNATRGLYYSTDAGATWYWVSTLSDSGAALHSNSAHSVVYNPIQKKFYAVVRAHGVYSSTDGIAWTRLATQPGGINAISCPPTTNLITCPIYRGEFGIRPGSDEMYLWLVNSSEVDGGIFRTLDGGATWTNLHTGAGSDGISSCGDGSSCGTSQGNYNLYLAAVPNPAPSDPNQTDIYAGAINIYKCTIPGSNQSTSTCETWLNLTHVYSCTPMAAPSHVHPDQHGIGFSLANPNIIYFGHDGGVSRTLNGPGLASGSCSGSNPFDNLTGTLGSVSEFVSFSQDPNNENVLLGGTQDNGSPALIPGFGGTATTWNEVHGVDGGYNEIDPNSTNVWYASDPGVNIFRCTAGTACTDLQFSPLVNSSCLNGDTGAFYTPYMLDPAATARMIVGTCRVWRGIASNSSHCLGGREMVSGNLANPSSVDACTGSDDLILALDAGGPAVISTGSQVIYAGTSAGRVFVTTSASTGSFSWAERTFSQARYPISSIFVDPSDRSGQTAYATVMGFGTGHVFKTVDAGVNWTQMDQSGSGLPDSPANSVVVDPIRPNIVYAGTDVGVFFTRDGSTWTEYGAGMPNVPVSHLRAYNNTGRLLLRASTYGRGVWQVPLASAPTGTLTFVPGFLTFANQTVTTTSAAQSITITAMNAPVTVNGLAISAQFGVSGCAGVTLAVGQSCVVSVTFAPISAGIKTGTITVTSSGTGSPQAISVTGNGITATGGAITPQTGWWWDGPHGSPTAGLNGIGFFIEQNPATTGIFMAGFLYDGTGKATWLVSTGSTSGSTYSNTWLRCTGGQTLLGTYKAPACDNSVTNHTTDTLSITFTSPTTATMTRAGAASIPLVRFSFTTTPIPPAVSGTPQIGWWWADPAGPAYGVAYGSGTGFGVEIQATNVFIVAYVYEGGGSPIWYLATGSLTSPTTYTGNWQQYGGGPTLTSREGTYSASVVNGNVSPMMLTFADATHASLTMGGITIPLVRFGSF